MHVYISLYIYTYIYIYISLSLSPSLSVCVTYLGRFESTQDVSRRVQKRGCNFAIYGLIPR